MELARPAIQRVGRVLAAGLLVGLVGQLLSFGVGIGINLPVGVALLVGAGWLTRRAGARLAPTDAWLGPAAVVFAGSVRASPTSAESRTHGRHGTPVAARPATPSRPPMRPGCSRDAEPGRQTSATPSL